MATTEKYTTIIELNSDQAKRNLEELRKKVEEWNDKLDDAKRNRLDKSTIAEFKKELSAAEKELRKYDTEVSRTIDTISNLDKASVKSITAAQKQLKRLVAEVPRGDDSNLFSGLGEQLDKVNKELEDIKAIKAFQQLQEEAMAAGNVTELTNAQLGFVKQTINDINNVSVNQLKLAEETAKGIRDSAKQGTEYDNASANLEKIRTKLSDIELKNKKVVTVAQQYNQVMKSIGMEERVVENESKLIERTLSNLSSASLRDIEFSIKAVKEELQDINHDSDNVKDLTEKLKKLNEEKSKILDMQSSTSPKGNIFSRGANFLNTNWGAITQTLGLLSGIKDVVRGSVQAFAEMDQEMNNVRKYTGQNIEEVERMNELFKKMDTRTSREQLNQLAGSAGRLGITATEDVMDFVDAADKINVALGDDLGKGAVDQIGKLAMAFGEDDKMGLRGAMLATGSAVNELAQNSSAQAGYLVDFAARLSGVGIQAGMTQSQIMGLGATLDENMQKDEMAATALMKLITMLATDSAKFAGIAGASVEEFSSLVKNDMNSALLMFFESMNKKGGFTELAPMFESLGLDGSRATGVLSVLAGKIDDVRKHQQLATDAYEKGTSVLDEFNVQNETYQAQLEKAQKAFHDVRVELGEKLLPLAGYSISTVRISIKLLNNIISVVNKSKFTLIALAVSLATVTALRYKDIVATSIQTAKTKLQIFWNDKLISNLKKLYGIIRANPYMAAGVAISTLIGLMADLISKNNSATAAQKALNNVEHDAIVKAELEKQKIDQLKTKIHDNNIEISKRREYIEQLQKIVPDYVAKISEEGRVYGESTEALDKYIEKIKEKARIDGAKKKIEEISEQRAGLVADQMLLETQINDLRKEQAKRRQNRANKPQTSGGAVAPGSVYEEMGDSATIASLESKKNELSAKIKQADEMINKLGNVAKSTINDTKGDAPKEDYNSNAAYDTKSYWENELKIRRQKLKILKEDAKSTSKEIEDAAEAVKQAEDKMEIFTGAKAGAKQAREEDNERSARQKKADDLEKAETERLTAELTHRYAIGKTTYRDYIRELERIQLDGIDRRMLIYGTESLEYQKLNREKEELLLNGSKEAQNLRLADVEQEHEKRMAAIEEQAWRENMTEQTKNEMLFLENMSYLEDKKNLYREGTLEYLNIEREIEEREQSHRLQNDQYYQQQLAQAREQLMGMVNEQQKELALKGLKEMYDALKASGVIQETEYQEMILAIQTQYPNYKTQSERDQEVGGNALKVAKDNAKKTIDNKGSSYANLPIVGDIMMYQTTMEQLEQMYNNDKLTHDQYLAAKQQATAEFCQSLASKMQAAYNSINNIMSAASSYFAASQEYELAQVKNKYDKQIAAAGNNQAKIKKLQEQQQKDEAAIKNKYAKRAAAIQMAQAIAQTAISAINAYSSAAAIPITGPALAPIAAAMAIAAGMLQIATIKKQQQAQAAGYYEGGFTGGRQYRKEAGVVHEGEFVANHNAVQNPAIMPFLSLIDQAQKNNTVGSLTMQDISRSMGAGGSAQVVAPIVNVQTDNEDLRIAVDANREATELLVQRLDEGIEAYSVIDGPKGLYHNLKLYERLLNKK